MKLVPVKTGNGEKKFLQSNVIEGKALCLIFTGGGGNMMSDFFKKAINLGFGALLITKENVEEIIDDLVKKGEIKADEAKAQVKEIFNKVLSSKKEIESKIEEIVEKALHKLDIPTRRELQEMQKKLDEIIKRLESREE